MFPHNHLFSGYQFHSTPFPVLDQEILDEVMERRDNIPDSTVRTPPLELPNVPHASNAEPYPTANGIGNTANDAAARAMIANNSAVAPPQAESLRLQPSLSTPPRNENVDDDDLIEYVEVTDETSSADEEGNHSNTTPSPDTVQDVKTTFRREIHNRFPYATDDTELARLLARYCMGSKNANANADAKEVEDSDEEEDDNDCGGGEEYEEGAEDDDEEGAVGGSDDSPNPAKKSKKIMEIEVEDICEEELARLEANDREGKAAVDKDHLENPHLTRKQLWMIRISGAFGDNSTKSRWGTRQREKAYASFIEEQEVIELEKNRRLSQRLAIERATAHEIDRILATLSDLPDRQPI